jgi:DNA repair ATPase RecN
VIYLERHLPGQVAARDASIRGYIQRLESELLRMGYQRDALDTYADEAIASAVRTRNESLAAARKEEREIIEARELERQREAAREGWDKR